MSITSSPLTSSAPALLSAKEWCLEVIRGLIFAGELRPGERVSIDALARDLSISRTPVRDALWHLEREGLVVISPRVGVFIREISAREINDIYALKEAFEPLMAQWAAERASQADRRRYREMVDELETLAKAGDVAGYIEALERVRDELVALAGSDALADMQAVIDGRVRLLRYRNLSQPGELARSAARHAAIAAAIDAGDGARAADAMQAHMRAAAERIRLTLAAEDAEAAAPGSAA